VLENGFASCFPARLSLLLWHGPRKHHVISWSILLATPLIARGLQLFHNTMISCSVQCSTLEYIDNFETSTQTDSHQQPHLQQQHQASNLLTWLLLPKLTIVSCCTGIDVASDPRAPRHSKTAEPADVTKTGLAFLHTAHCLGSGDIMVWLPGAYDFNSSS